MTWRPISDPPKSRVAISVLIAAREGPSDDFFLLGIRLYRSGRWLDEDTGKPLEEHDGYEYWWIAEDELLEAAGRDAAAAMLERAG